MQSQETIKEVYCLDEGLGRSQYVQKCLEHMWNVVYNCVWGGGGGGAYSTQKPLPGAELYILED